MTNNLDLHDTISVIIPGACGLCCLSYFYYGDINEVVKMLTSLSVGTAVLFITISYIVGEILHALGELSVKKYYKRYSGGEPLLWLLKSAREHPRAKKFLPEKVCSDVFQSLVINFNMAGEETNAAGFIEKSFSHIKKTVYANDASRTECIKMLTKTNFYSAMAAMFLLVFLGYTCTAVINTNWNDLCYELKHFKWDEVDFSKFALSETQKIIAGSFLLTWLCACRYSFFNIIYNRTLITAYWNTLNHPVPPCPQGAAGETSGETSTR